MKRDRNRDLYNLIIDMNSKAPLDEENLSNIYMLCKKLKISKEEYDTLVKKIINHKNIINIDVSSTYQIYEKNNVNDNNQFVKYFAEALNSTLLEDIFELLNSKNFTYNLTKMGIEYYGWADEQLFIQSFLLQKIYQYMIINNEKIQNKDFVNKYYNYLIQIFEISESFEEVMKKCDYILINDIIRIEHLNKSYKKNEILDLIKQKFINDGYCFHGFNSSFEDNILKYGLSGQLNWCDVKNMKKIDAILRKNGITDSFQQNWDYQVHPNFFTTDNFGAAYYYSVLSPVFLSRLVSNGKYMIDETKYNRTAFFYKSISACIKNIQRLLYEYNVSKKEQEEILIYLESLLNSVLKEKDTLKIAFIPRQDINRNFSLNYDKALLMKNISTIQDLIFLALKPAFELDRHQNVTYSADIISTIDIPNFAKKITI